MPIPESPTKKIVLINLGASRELVPLVTLLQKAVSLRIEEIDLEVESWEAGLVDQQPPDFFFICFAIEKFEKADAIKKTIQRTFPRIPIMFVRAPREDQQESDLFYWDGIAFSQGSRSSDEGIQSRQSRPEDLAPSTSNERLRLKQFVGESSALLKLTQMIPKVAQSDATVMISGETGTGKELVARAIHSLSARNEKPFVPVNCGAIPVDLVENELFGHEEGAFTGASSSSAGVIREAEGGTLFLDEIDSLPLQSQIKLLRFLQEREYRPLGACKTSPADVRVISASSANFDEAIQRGRFRLDLFYRLHVMPLHVPPLRERKDDIPLLARHLVGKYSEKNNLALKPLSVDAIAKLIDYRWPGNVRELENVLERAVIVSKSPCIEACDIDLPKAPGGLDQGSFKMLKAKAVKEFETEYLQKLLALNEGNVAKAAKAAGKHRRAFQELLRKHRIDVRKLIRPDNKV
jgi:two-component system, NtrC family, response regulator GlrR